MGHQTALHDAHIAMQAKIVDFSGWDMPLHYGSQLDEHECVRSDAGMFDVSHMTVVDIEGMQAQAFLSYLLANDVARLKQPGKALYSAMLNVDGGVIDDLIVFYMNDQRYRVVVNAGTREKDLAWIAKCAEDFDVTVTPRLDRAIIAVQGPNARDKVHTVLDAAIREKAENLGVFFGVEQDEFFISRTGYTGEDGYEIIVPADQAAALWQSLSEAGVMPIGLGARDTLRLEAGMNLYGTDMDETTSPLESGLGWTIAWMPEDRDFIGRAALQAKRDSGPLKRFVGLLLEDRGMLRNGQTLMVGDNEVGHITSGSFSPSLGKAIALARVDSSVTDTCEVVARNKRLVAKVIKPSFVRHGKSCVD